MGGSEDLLCVCLPDFVPLERLINAFTFFYENQDDHEYCTESECPFELALPEREQPNTDWPVIAFMTLAISMMMYFMLAKRTRNITEGKSPNQGPDHPPPPPTVT